MKTRVYGYADNPTPLKWKGPFYSRELAVAEGLITYRRSSGFYLVEGEVVQLRDFMPDADRLTDLMLEELWMIADEKGLDASAFPEVASIHPPAREQLHSAVLGWVSVYTPTGWVPVGKPEFVAVGEVDGR
jgi:hypothetical protein